MSFALIANKLKSARNFLQQNRDCIDLIRDLFCGSELVLLVPERVTSEEVC